MKKRKFSKENWRFSIGYDLYRLLIIDIARNYLKNVSLLSKEMTDR